MIMKRPLFVTLFCLMAIFACSQETCSKLGAWLWYIEISQFGTHARLADSLSSLGIRRIYVKVADGNPNPAVWPELTDRSLVQTYKNKGLEVWAWSYNYPGNEALQASALKIAAETGYQGFVVDVESEFDAKAAQLSALFTAFRTERDLVRASHPGFQNFQLYCTTWGNPEDHAFAIDAIDPHVDAFMPQTYVEEWGAAYMSDPAYWIRYGNEEYRRSGAQKPLHHIVSAVKGNITPVLIDRFFEESGSESSIWVVPGQNTGPALWQNTWKAIDWKRNFCVSGQNEITEEPSISLFPVPAVDYLEVRTSGEVDKLGIYSLDGRLLLTCGAHTADISSLSPGVYLAKVKTKINKCGNIRFVKF